MNEPGSSASEKDCARGSFPLRRRGGLGGRRGGGGGGGRLRGGGGAGLRLLLLTGLLRTLRTRLTILGRRITTRRLPPPRLGGLGGEEGVGGDGGGGGGGGGGGTGSGVVLVDVELVDVLVTRTSVAG